MHRLAYLVYYFRDLSTEKFRKFEKFALKETGWSRSYLWLDMVWASLRYNISFLDYFYFRFFRADTQRDSYAGTGFMYEFQLRMNPPGHRVILEDKLKFIDIFAAFVKRRVVSVQQMTANHDAILRYWEAAPAKLVAKYSRGQVGAEVHVIRKDEFDPASFLKYLHLNRLDMVEDFVDQHPALQALSPAGLNTVRVITQLSGTKVVLIAARLRVTVNSAVDNLAAGNMAAPLDVNTGRVTAPAVYSDITLPEVYLHPITGKELTGFQVPHWQEVVSLVRNAALTYPGNRSVGWDVAIAANHVELIEGNHNWCKLLWQLPAKKGLKSELLAL